MLNPRLALGLAAALLVVPAFATPDASTGARSSAASVVADGSAYVETTVYSPALSLTTPEADAIRVMNSYATGTTFDVTVTKTSGSALFVLVAPTSTTGLAVGSSFTVRIRDTSPLTSTSDNVGVRVDVVFRSGGSDVGGVTFTRTVAVSA